MKRNFKGTVKAATFDQKIICPKKCFYLFKKKKYFKSDVHFFLSKQQ